MAASAARRPLRVTFIAILTWLHAVLNLLIGILLLIFQNDASIRLQFGGTSGVIVTGVVLIVLSLIVFAVAGGLMRGSRSARAIVTIVQVLSIGSALYTALLFPAQVLETMAGAAISLVIILMLWSGRAGEYFRR